MVEPTAIGIFTPGSFQSAHEKLVVNPVDGVSPDMNTLASGTYPLARTLYLYVDKKRYDSNYFFMDGIMLTLVSPMSYWGVSGSPRDAAFWGFIPLEATEQAALRKDRDRFKALQF
jgi:hypothetical protein